MRSLPSLAGALLVLAGWAARAFADQAAGIQPAKVRLTVAADAEETARLHTVVQELLGRLQIVTEPRTVDRIDLGELSARSAGGDPYLARAWVDLQRRDVAILYLLDVRRERLLVRQVERPAGGDELAREQLGHILETSCEGLLAGETIGVARAEVMPLLGVAADSSAAPALAPRAPTWEWAAGAHWGVAVLSSEAAFTQGPALSASVLAPPRAGLRFGAALWGQLRLPVEAYAQTDNGSEGLQLRGWALRAIAIAERQLGRRVSARLGVGGGGDLMRAEPRAAANVALLAPPRSVRVPIATAAAAFDYSLARSLRLGATLTVDVDLSGTEFAFSTASGSRAVLRPWPVRPGLLAGVIW